MLRFIFILLTIVEVMALVASFALLGFWLTLLLSIAAMMVGGYLLQREGLKTLEVFVSRLESGHAPMQEAWDGACLMVAGIFFIIPGLVTDALGLLLLLPFVRRLLYRLFARTGDYRYDESALSSSRATIIETHYEDITKE